MTKRKKESEKLVTGRPTDYRPEYCQMIKEHMKNGATVLSFAASIGKCKDSVYTWARNGKHPEFTVALREAKALSEAHWEKVIALKTIKKTEGSDALLMFWMKNRFGWRDKTESNIKQETKTVVEFTSEIATDGSVKRDKSDVQLDDEDEI